MISKRVFIDPSNDNYARLAVYIADAGHSDEKCLLSWAEGMLGGEDYAEGIAEAVDVQARNTRAASKTYHLVISFRPEDEVKLTPEVFKNIEQRFAAALGYTDHQRHCGIHKNTGNLHMHVAYNMIDPEKYTCHKEFRDFRIRDRLCREIEREFGLTVDNGREQRQENALSQKAATVEAQNGQESFESYAKGHHEEIMDSLTTAASWQELHRALAKRGMEIKPHGRGLAIKDRHSKRASHAIKASALDRSLSRQKLEDRFGPYQAPQDIENIQERSRYSAGPLHRSPERGQLFVEYQAGIATRKDRLRTIKEQEDATLTAIRAEWAAKRQELERKNIAKKNLRQLLQLTRKHETEALAKARLDFQEAIMAVRREIPFTSWNGFLQQQADQGNEVALAVLRSREQAVEPEQPASVKDWSQHGRTRVEFAAKERAVLEMDGISGKAKSRLQSVLRMEQVTGGFLHHVTRKGMVVFTFQDGSTIKDSGKDILFSAGSDTARQVAMLYAHKKWGKQIVLEKNRIFRHDARDRSQGMER